MRKNKNLTKNWHLVASIAAFSIVALGASFILGGGGRTLDFAKAGGVTPTVTPSAQTVSTAGAIAIAYTASVAMPVGTTIQLTYSSSYTGTITTGNTTVNTVAPSAVTAPTLIGPGTNRVTITTNSVIAAAATVTINLTGLTTPATAGNYAFGINTSTNDFGGNFQYVGESNVVQVRAFVPLRLAFNIRNSADTANTNVCDLGETDPSAINECSYRLKVSTNAIGGYTISMQANGNLTNGAYSMTNAVAGPTGSAISASSALELYGVRIVAGGITGSGTISTLPAYTSGVNNVVNYSSTTAANIVQSTGPNATPAAGGDTTNTTLVTHRLTVSESTPIGTYTQRITYRVTPTF
jgi:hypothetical protein